MTVNEKSVFSAMPGLQLCDDVLDVSIMMSHAVSKLKVERTPGFLQVYGQFVNGLAALLYRSQLITDEIDSENFIFVTP